MEQSLLVSMSTRIVHPSLVALPSLCIERAKWMASQVSEKSVILSKRNSLWIIL